MALPPEPLPELLSRAELIVAGEVTAIVAAETAPAPREVPLGASDLGIDAPAQTVEIRVDAILRGSELPEPTATALTADKPEAPYRLEVGSRGAFFLEHRAARWRILGRYGPDSYSLSAVRQRVQAARSA